MKRFLAAWAVTVALLLCAGQAYAAATLLPPGENCFQATVGINGMVGTLGTVTGGSGGTAGTYAGVALTGGSGSGATANVTVAGGAVTAVAILNPGTQYVVGDTLSAASGSIGGTSGFSVPVASVAINSSLAGGTVGFFVPNTSTFKQTWANAAQTILNTNPVTLDQNGCAIIYGTGSYRQILKDSLLNTVWDQVTTDTSANNNTFWADVAGGTPNVITVVDPGFNATGGSIINFTALSTNTSSVTLNPSGFGAIPVLKDTTAGPVALIGGEIIQTNPISVIFRASDNAFHLLNPPIQSASGATAPLCGATGLKITNNASLPSTTLNLTAMQAVIQTASGLTINRSNVSLLNINITTGQVTSTANGMDGEVPGTSAWLYVYLIDNGAAPAGLVSTSSTAPTLPSGYTYRCRVGAVRVDGSSNLLRTLQLGARTQYVVVAASNTAAYPSAITGTSGAPTVPTYTSVSLTSLIPPTAPALNAFLNVGVSAGTAQAIVSPNIATGPVGISANSPPVQINLVLPAATTVGNAIPFTMLLETANTIFYASNAGVNTGVYVTGWVDAVNAN